MVPFIFRSRGVVTGGALTIAAVVGALSTQAASTTTASAATAPRITAEVKGSHVRYDEDVVVTGKARGLPDEAPVTLQHRSGEKEDWENLATEHLDGDDEFRFETRAPENGDLRVVAGNPTALRAAASVAARTIASDETRVRVAPVLKTTNEVRNVSVGRSAKVSGRISPARKGRTVRLLVRRGGKWRTVDKDSTSTTGRYALKWKTKRPGRMTMRVKLSSTRDMTSTRRTLGRLNVYRTSFASWYGPGFYGRRTACGQTLGHGTVGVAHKTLPCGTKVTFRRGDRIVTARVIDRGPFHPGREWDLTGALKRKLGFGSTGRVQSTV